VSTPLRVAALISGAGSNLAVMLDAIAAGTLDAQVLEVISNRAQAPGLDLARAHGVPTRIIDAVTAGDAGQDAAIRKRLETLAPDLVLLTGYMRILGPEPVNAFHGKMINQHPSLLPRHKGLHTHRRAIEAGDREHGASLHFVTPELDDGPVIAQVRVPIRPDDDDLRLADRLRPREQALLLAVLALFAAKRLELGADGVRLDGQTLNEPLILEEDTLHVSD
jgi:phosphoribosylglycinamide formyltransferase-1